MIFKRTQGPAPESQPADYTPLFNELPPPMIEAQRNMGLSDEDVFDIFVRPWLEELSEKPIRFISDPTKAAPESLPGRQWAILRDEYKMIYDEKTRLGFIIKRSK